MLNDIDISGEDKNKVNSWDQFLTKYSNVIDLKQQF